MIADYIISIGEWNNERKREQAPLLMYAWGFVIVLQKMNLPDKERDCPIYPVAINISPQAQK